jgi:branched-chain amino acid aminotransferase
MVRFPLGNLVVGLNSTVFLDQKFYKEEDAKVSILDHGYLYGNGCWTTMMTSGDRIFFIDDHMDRLLESANIIGLDIPWTKNQIKDWTLQTYDKNKHLSGRSRIRVGLYKGVGSSIVVGATDCEPSINIIVSPYPVTEEENAVEKGLYTITVPADRPYAKSKNCNYLPSYVAVTKAKQQGKDDAIFINYNGDVTESTTGNLFYIKDDIIYTAEYDILYGITRKVILDYRKDIVETMYKLETLLEADEVFISGTTKLIIPVVQINDTIIGDGKPGKQTMQLRKEISDWINLT